MPYTQLALHTLAAVLTFALVAFVARRSSSDARAMLAAIVIGLALGYVLSAAIGFLAMFMPLGQIDFFIAAKLKQLGFVK